MFNFTLNGWPRFATSRPHESLSDQSELFRPRSGQASNEVKRGPAPYEADLATGREHQLTTGKRAERTKHDFRCSICRSAILYHWSSQLFDLRAPSSTDAPVLLLNQPIKSDEGLFWKSVDDQFPNNCTKTWYSIREKLRISMFFFILTLKVIYHCERVQKERIRAIVTKAVVIAILCPSFSFINSLTWRIWLNLRFRTPSFTLTWKYTIKIPKISPSMYKPLQI